MKHALNAPPSWTPAANAFAFSLRALSPLRLRAHARGRRLVLGLVLAVAARCSLSCETPLWWFGGALLLAALDAARARVHGERARAGLARLRAAARRARAQRQRRCALLRRRRCASR